MSEIMVFLRAFGWLLTWAVGALLLALLFYAASTAAPYAVLAPDGTALNVIELDAPPAGCGYVAGCTIVPRDQVPAGQLGTFGSVAAPATPRTVISAAEFQARFSDAEQGAIWAAAAKDPSGQIGAGLTRGLTAGQIDLAAPALKAWLDALVAAGALTAAREAQILTP
jgi:hypothetical protein